ncbi:hypothetical protein CKK33_02630 [Mucilaginibacter sp. MD40]|uniref:hypothetical protein n=1 Tax=Mucilaginibacter sp. MD40 TaxID=2029590 RepID=UPI000BACB9D3|nr:hypothetical protein [Mucilaginibacter sp. MD40]PAW92449.1 hypothetical protein CKK33_02630 [Mucilaginibacter sp. MD40]
MDIQTEKIELAKRLLETNDELILRQIKDILEGVEWNDLPDHVQAGIKRAQQQATEGLLAPHDTVIKKYDKYL